MKKDKKILVAYYTYSGNTEKVADYIGKNTGGDIFRIVPEAEYPADYNKSVEQAKREIKDGFMPAVIGNVADMDSYDVVFVGSPNWWSTIAPPVATFLSMYDFSGKMVIPFCTHGGGGRARLFSDITKAVGQTVLPGLELNGSRAASSQGEVLKWLKSIKVIG